MNANDLFKFLVERENRCNRQIVVRPNQYSRRWTCGLPNGHEGRCARVTLTLREFDSDGPYGKYSVDLCVPAERPDA